MPDKKSPAIPPNYGQILETIKHSIRTARVKAHLAVNRELVLLYWSIGRLILNTQAQEGWGAKVIDQLSRDLNREFPDMTGLSTTNLKYMRAFAASYPADAIVQGALGPLETASESGRTHPTKQPGGTPSEIVQQPAGQLEPPAIVQGLLGQLPWWSNIALLDKLDSTEQRLWYARKTIEHGWSRNLLVHQIESKLYERQALAPKTTNFEHTLPPEDSDLVRELIKDPYNFEFVALTEAHQERDLHKALLHRIQDFLLELGVGFAFVGSNYRLVVEGDEFFADLLFYHIRLRRYIVIELKTRKFDPRDAGQLSFYTAAVDALLCQPDDRPTIGLLLCKSRNSTVAEYSLRGTNQPMSVSTYRIADNLPDEIKGVLPTPEQLARELEAVLPDQALEE